MLEQGGLRRAIDSLVYLHQRLSEARIWERFAYQIIKKVSSTPLESVSWPEGPIWSLDASDEDWFLGIGTSDGAAYVKRLRIPISPVKEHWQSDYWLGYEGPLTVSLMDETVNLMLRQEQCPPADVRFPPGACLNQSLEVRRGPKGSAEFLLSTKASKPSLRKEFKDELAAFRRYSGSISLTCDGLLTITSQVRTKSVTLPLLDEMDCFFALEVVQGEGSHEFRLWIACLSKKGRLYVVDEEGGSSFQDLQWTEQARRLYAVPAHHSFIVETELELFIIGLRSMRGPSFTLDLVLGHPDKRITSSIMFQMSDQGQDIVLGYADGSVEICPAHYWASSQKKRAAFSLHRNPVIALGPVPGYVGFFSVSKESVAILRNPERGADHIVFSPNSEITTACLTRDGTHLITGHSNHRLMLWDVERTGRSDSRVQRWNRQDPNNRITLISDVLSTVPQARWLILNGAVRTHDDCLWVSADASVFFVTRSAFTPVTSGPGEGSAFSARFCWSLTGESILLLRTPSGKDDIHTYLMAPLTVIRFLDNDRVLSQDIRIGQRRPTAYAAHPFNDAYCVGFDNGTVIEVSFSSKTSPRYKVTRRISTVSGASVSSCAYSQDGAYLAVSLKSEPYIMIADLTTKEVRPLNHVVGDEGRIYTGPARFAPHGNVLFVCTNDGGVSSVEIQSGRIELLQYYPPPRHLSSSLQFLSLATSGTWFVGGIGSSVYRWKTDGGVQDLSVYIVSDVLLRHLSAVPNADRFISIDAKGECICWDALSGERVADITTDAYWHNDLGFSPDGSLVSVRVNATWEEAVFPIFKTDLILLDRKRRSQAVLTCCS
jgi:WD40 repeat protein